MRRRCSTGECDHPLFLQLWRGRERARPAPADPSLTVPARSFDVDDVRECRRRLLACEPAAWSEGLLERLDAAPEQALWQWFALTRQAKTASLQEVCAAEEALLDS